MANGNGKQPAATSDTLTPKQQRALTALLSEPTVLRAAQASGIGERTLHTWIRSEPFTSEYRNARREMVAHATIRLAVGAEKAVMVLEAVMYDKSTPAAVRVSAAKVYLDYVYKSVELEDITARLDALEGKR